MGEMEQQPQQGQQERTWAMLCHLSALAGFIIPLGGILGPLVVWLVKKDEFPVVDDQGKESLNFQITMVIAAAVAGVLILVAIGTVLLAAVGIYDIVMVIVASMRANKGERYRYPLCLRLIT
jgi:uncharacterized Tic20 family protein